MEASESWAEKDGADGRGVELLPERSQSSRFSLGQQCGRRVGGACHAGSPRQWVVSAVMTD